MTWYLYLLRCGDDTIYTGISNDLQRRLAKHRQGSASRYTRSRLPVKLLYQEACRDHSDALRKEAAMKRISRRNKERYIKDHGSENE